MIEWYRRACAVCGGQPFRSRTQAKQNFRTQGAERLASFARDQRATHLVLLSNWPELDRLRAMGWRPVFENGAYVVLVPPPAG